MALPNLLFSVASEYDGKGLGKARKDVNAFSKNIKNLARTVGVSLSAAALVQFGKSSVKAFSDAEREGVVLTNTMKNLGLAFQTSQVEAYINSIGRLYGVTGDQAVPAMQALVSATGSVTKAQQLMNTALNISAQTGIDVTSVAKGLSQAYLGNRKALSQYNTGLTKAELQLMSFTDLQLRLDKIFAGSATAAAATYSGQMLILAENAEQAKEVIGKGLVDSFTLLAGEGGLPSATSAMQDFATATAEATVGAASLIEKLTSKLSPGGFNLTGLIPVIGGYIGPGGVLDKLRAEGRKVTTQNMGAPGVISGKSLGGAQYFAAQEKAEKASLKRQRELAAIENKRLANLRKLAAEANKKLALDKLSAFLNKSQKLFDMDRIQLAAAGMSKQTEEDQVRIRLKTQILDLEDAIAEGNVEAAMKYAALITKDAELLGKLRMDTLNFGDFPNPYATWLETLQASLLTLQAMSVVTQSASNWRAFSGQGKNAYEGFGSGMSDLGLDNYGGLAGAGQAGGGGAPVINYNINASGIGDQQIAAIVQSALQNLNRYGNSTTFAGAL
jgi:hypothetical protein